MNQIEELERTLPGRLRTSAAVVTPDAAALSSVRARVADQRRRARTAVVLGSAAAVALVALGVGLSSGGESPSGIVAGPASSAEEPAAPTTTVPDDADATLLIYRFSNVTEEMIAEDPTMGGEFAELNTASQTCFASGPVEGLGGESPCIPSNVGELLTMVDASAPLHELALREPVNVAMDLMRLLSTGVATAEQVSQITAQLQALPGVSLSSSDGGGTVTVDWQDPGRDTMSITLDTSTGHPIRRRWSGDPRSDMEYVSVTRVRAADYLVPGRGTPGETATTTTLDAAETPG